MEAQLKKHLLEESRAMLAESKKALARANDELFSAVAQVEEGDTLPLRKQLQRKALSSEFIERAIKEYHETLKRPYEEPREHAESLKAKDLDRAAIEAAEIEARITEENERLRQEVEKAEIVKIEAERAEKQRIEAEKALAAENTRLEALEQKRAAIRKRVEEEQARLDKEKAEAEALEARTIAEAKSRQEREESESNRKAEEDRLANEAADKLAKLEFEKNAAREEEERKAKEEAATFAKQEAERLAKEDAAKREMELLAKSEALQLETERLAKEEFARVDAGEKPLDNAKQEDEILDREGAAKQEAGSDVVDKESASLNSRGLEGREEEEKRIDEDDEAERALREALAERDLLETSMRSHDESELSEPGIGPIGDATEDVPTNHTEESYPIDSAEERKYVSIQDTMLQPAKTRFYAKTLKPRLLVLREDKFRYYDETGTKVLGALSLKEEGVEVVLSSVKKSPSGLSLKFSSLSIGTWEFFPPTEEMGKKWISAIEHNMEINNEIPDLGPEEAMTFYDYLRITPEMADTQTLLQAYADATRGAKDEWVRNKLNEALQVLNDPFKRVEYDNFVNVQRKYRFGGISVVQIRTPKGEATDAVKSRVFTDATFSYLYWQDIRLGPSLTGRFLCVELVRIDEVQPGPSSNAVNMVLNNSEIVTFLFKEKREAEDFGAAIRFAKAPLLSSAARRRQQQQVMETSV